MDAAVKEFCDQVRISGSLNIQDCGINKRGKFVFGRSVASSDNRRLLGELTIHPALSHLTGKRVVTKHELSPYYDYLAAGTEKPLPGRVTLVTCKNGLLAWVGRENGIKPYGVVSSVDQDMRLDAGVAKAVKDKFGGAAGKYNRVSQQRQNRINYGECFTYDSTRDDKTYDLNNCQTIHNVLVPLAVDRNFEAGLKKTFHEVFTAADRNGVNRVFCPLLGCGRAGGTGKALAKAVSEAKTDFEATGKQTPELILVGMSSITSDQAACRDFESKWGELGRRISSTRPPVPGLKTPFTRTRPITGTSASSSVAGNEKTLAGRVTMVTCNNGLLAWVGRENGIKPYGIVSSVDPNMQLDNGVAKVIKDKFGGTWGNYNRVSQQPQNRINYGECFTYDCERGSKPSDLSNCRTVHNVLVPLAGDWDFQAALKNTFLRVFQAADRHGVNRVFCPLLGCGRAGGSGKALAQAVSEAKADFEATGKQAPELILVGMSSIAKDKAASADFESKWNELGQRTPSTRSPGKMPSAITSTGAAATSATTVAASGYNTSSELIRGQLEVAMNSDKGMFGYAKELSKQGVLFDLVNAANREMKHGGGIAEQFSKDLGKQFDRDTRRQAPVPTSSCYTTQSYGYARDPKFGLSHCQYIHNVVAPDVKDYTVIVQGPGGRKKQRFDEQRYHQDFTNAFVSLLLEADKKGSNTIVGCFLGCAIFGGSGMDMARALHAAFQDPRIHALPKVPKLILVGWKDDDWQVHNDFIQTFAVKNILLNHFSSLVGGAKYFHAPWAFDSLNTAYPLRLPSGRAPARPSSTDISGTAFPPGSGTIRKKPSSYAPSGARLSPRSRPASPVSTPADSLLPLVKARKVSHPEGVLGYAQKRSGNIKPFSLVNAVHDASGVLSTEVALKGGVQGGYIEHMIKGGGKDALKRKQYQQCEAWDYKKTDGYKGCKKIHSVLFPQITDRHGFSERLVTLLMNASPGERLLFPLYELEGITESALNDVLNRAYSDPQVLLMAKNGKLPKLCVVRKTPASPMSDDDFVPMGAGSRLGRSHSRGMSSSGDHDSTSRSASPEPATPSANSYYDDSFDTLVSSRLGRMAIGRASAEVDDVFSSSSGKCSAATGVSKSGESTTTAFRSRGKTIDCGICGESKPEKGSQQVKGLEVCSDCAVGYKDQGVSLSEAAKLAEEYTAIDYKPLKITRDRRDLPGYPGAGRITVRIEATAPACLSDGRRLDTTYKNETHYLPDNDVGKELLRLLKILHQEKLIYKIDKSNTTGNFAITFNFHLKTADSGGERNHGYPDMTYPGRALNEIVGLASTHSLQDKLDTSKLVSLVFGGS